MGPISSGHWKSIAFFVAVTVIAPTFEDNQKFFREADMTIAPMVLDQDEPSPRVKDAFAQFASDGLATIVQDEHHLGGKLPKPQV